MTAFLHDLPRFEFLQYALTAGALASLACGVVGSYVVTRRISYIAGGIAHSVLGGIGAARYFQVVHGQTWLDPLLGALFAALLAALTIGLASLKAKEREDTVIGGIWAIGMAAGILFISRTPGYSEDLVSYLFGNILLVGSRELLLLGLLDALVVGLAVVFYHNFLAVCFDEEFSRLRGLPTAFFYLFLLVLVALTVVVLMTVVGIVLVIALLTLPAAMAGRFTRSLRGMMALASVFCLLLTSGGLALSYGPDLPVGATVIMLAGAAYLAVSLGGRRVRQRLNP